MLYDLTPTSQLLKTWLHRLRPPSERSLGRAGYRLHRLAMAGLPLAPTWVLGAEAFDLALVQAGLSDRVAEIDWSLGGLWNDLAAMHRVLTALDGRRVETARALRQAALPERLERPLSDLARVKATAWIARGSFTAGDESGLRLVARPTRHDLWDAVRQVWASALSRQALEWAAQSDVPLPRAAVVLQAVDGAARSGVAYSASPLPAVFPGVMIRVYERLVACDDEANSAPVHYGVDARDQVRFERINGRQNPAPLTWDEALLVARLARCVTAEWGAPTRIEFVWGAEGPLLTGVDGIPAEIDLRPQETRNSE